MADPRELLLGTPEEVADYRRWESGRNANTLAPVKAVGEAALSAAAKPSIHLASALAPTSMLAPEPLTRVDPRVPGTVPGEYVPIEVAQDKAIAAGEGFSPYHYEMGRQIQSAAENRAQAVPEPSDAVRRQLLGPDSVPDPAPARRLGDLADQTRLEPAVRQAQFGDLPPEALTAKVDRLAAEELASRVPAGAPAAVARAASAPTTRGLLERGAAMLSGTVDAAALGTLPFAAAGAMGASEAAKMSPAGDLRYMAFDTGQGPLGMEMVGQHAQFLADHPDVAQQLWQDGVLSTPAFVAVQNIQQTQPSLEPMRRAMATLEQRQSAGG